MRPAGTLPSLGDGSGMSLSAERQLGDSIAKSIYRDPDYLDDPVLVDYLQRLWQPLLASAQQRGDVPPELGERLAWELMISRDKRVNAFALPGGYLGVQLGLVAVTETAGELASVMAHELSHVSQRHIARMLSRQDQQAPWILGAMILGALAASASANVDVANAAIVGSQAAAAQSQLNFSRDMEREADRVGFGVLTGAGFEGQGFVSMFEKLQQASRLNDDGGYPYLRSHPLNSERMADMRARLPADSATARVGPLRDALPHSTPSLLLHSLMAARARVLMEKSPDRLRAWVQTGQAASARPADRYAAALAALQLGQRAQALQSARALQSQSAAMPEADVRWALDALVLETASAVAMAGAQAGPGLPAVDMVSLRDTALASTQRALVLLGAEAALASQAPAAVSNRLRTWVVSQPRDAAAWVLLSRAYAAQGQRVRAVRADAEARAAHLDVAGAIERLKAAQALPPAERNADPMELAIVDARRRALEQQERESAREQ